MATFSRVLVVVCLLFLILAGTVSVASAATLQDAESLYAGGQFDAAIQVLLSGDLAALRGTLAYERLLGRCYAEQGKIPEAVSALERGIASATGPQDLEVLQQMKRLLASCYAAAKDWTKAISMHESLAADHPELAATCLLWAGKYYVQQENIASAISAFTRGIAAAKLPDDLAVMHEIKRLLGSCYAASEDWLKAASTFESLATDDPGGAVGWLHRAGEYYIKDGKTADAISALTRGIASAKLPQDLALVREMSRLLSGSYVTSDNPEMRRQLFTTQAAAAKEALQAETDPQKKIGLMSWLSDCYREAGDFDTALGSYEQLLLEAPQLSADTHFNMASCFEGKQDYDRAIALYKQIIAEDNPDKMTKRLSLLYTARCLREQGKCEEEIDYLKTVAEQHPDNRLEALLWIGEDTCMYLRDYEGGLAALRQVVIEMPSDEEIAADTSGIVRNTIKEAQVLIGLVTLWQLHQRSEARAYFQALLTDKRFVDEVEVRHYLAYCSYDEQKWAEARTLFQMVYYNYPVSPKHPGAIDKVADCSMRLGDLETARAALEELIRAFPNTAYAEAAAVQLSTLLNPQEGKQPGATLGPPLTSLSTVGEITLAMMFPWTLGGGFGSLQGPQRLSF